MGLLSFVASCVIAWKCFSSQKHVRNCTAVSAGRWSCLAAVCLTAVNAMAAWRQVWPSQPFLAHMSVAQYGAAVLLLAPSIDLLGARRPGHDAWPWFVVLPMIVVLQWPSLTQWYSAATSVAVEVPAPTFVGFLFVALMGAGNFFGTANTMASLTTAVGIVLIALPVSDLVSFETRLLPYGTLAIAVGVFRFRFPAGGTGPEHLWNDYRDLYGIVWAKRVADRVNQFQQTGEKGACLTIEGYLDSEGRRAKWSESSTQRLAWVLRRFLDQEFLARYLADSQLADRDQFSGPENMAAEKSMASE